jgi:hypothetical protein
MASDWLHNSNQGIMADVILVAKTLFQIEIHLQYEKKIHGQYCELI